MDHTHVLPTPPLRLVCNDEAGSQALLHRTGADSRGQGRMKSGQQRYSTFPRPTGRRARCKHSKGWEYVLEV